MYDLAPASQHVTLTAAHPVQLKNYPPRRPTVTQAYPAPEFDFGTGSSRKAIRWMPFAGKPRSLDVEV